MQLGFVVILILSLITGVFTISNSSVVTIDFIFTEVLISQAIVIFICILIGAVITTIFASIRQMSLRKNIKHLKLENDKLEKENSSLRVHQDQDNILLDLNDKDDEFKF